MKPHVGWFLAALVSFVIAMAVLLTGQWSAALVVLALAAMFAAFSYRDRVDSKSSTTSSGET